MRTVTVSCEVDVDLAQLPIEDIKDELHRRGVLLDDDGDPEEALSKLKKIFEAMNRRAPVSEIYTALSRWAWDYHGVNVRSDPP